MGFANADGTPSDIYKKFRNSATTGRAAAESLKFGYAPLYKRNEFMHALSDEELKGLVIEENWWDSGRINQQVVKEVNDRIQKELDSGVTRRSMDKLDYTTFGELSVIITANWEIFGSIFNSRKGVERVLSNLNTLRGPIAHCAKLSEDEVIRLSLTVRDWFRTMQ